MNSYINAAHERLVERIVAEELPGVSISTSSTTLPEMQEYERAITSVANAFVKPVVARYVENLQGALVRETDHVRLSILRSDGGLASARRALAEAEARRAAYRDREAAMPKEVGGRKTGLEPGRYGDWEVKGIASDF